MREATAVLVTCAGLLIHASSVAAQPPPASGAILELSTTRDPAVDALVNRYRSAVDPREAQRAFDELRASARTSPPAAYWCGLLASQDRTSDSDRRIALQCLEQAAKAGIPEAQHRLAVLLIANGDERQRSEAERWLTSAAGSLPESVYLLALLTADRQADPHQARRTVIEKAAAAGYAPAQFELARRHYATGTSTGKALSLELLAKAAEQKHGEAAAELAQLLDADKREEDIRRIVALLETASAAGSPLGEYALGMRLMEARGVKRDTERGFALFRRAASRGYVPAMYATGFALGQGLGIGSDEAAAVEWFRRAADRGSADAMYSIGNSYANGWGVGKSMDLAYQWYCRAAKAGNKAGIEMISRAPQRCDLGARP